VKLSAVVNGRALEVVGSGSAEDLSAWAFEIRKDLAFTSGEFAAALHCRDAS
jgi:hypothetical protein